MSDGVVLANLISDVLDSEILIGWNVYLADVFAIELLLLATHDVLQVVDRDLI